MKYSKHFQVSEVTCHCGCGQYRVEYRTMCMIEKLRERFGAFTPNCVNRCDKHNATIDGSSETSGHIYGVACDYPIPCNTNRQEVWEFLEANMQNIGGIIEHETFIHFDFKDRYYRKRLND